jgi:hypothetical protein
MEWRHYYDSRNGTGVPWPFRVQPLVHHEVTPTTFKYTGRRRSEEEGEILDTPFCQLCGYNGLKSLNEIVPVRQNQPCFNRVLWVGDECICCVTDAERSELNKEFRANRRAATLEALGYDLESPTSPRDLLGAFIALIARQIPYFPLDFKVRLRRDSDKAEILSLPRRQVDLLPLTHEQITKVVEWRNAATKCRVSERRQAKIRKAARIEAARIEAERLAAKSREDELARLEALRLEDERREAERLAWERNAPVREAARLEREAREAERREARRIEAERREAERIETEIRWAPIRKRRERIDAVLNRMGKGVGNAGAVNTLIDLAELVPEIRPRLAAYPGRWNFRPMEMANLINLCGIHDVSINLRNFTMLSDGAELSQMSAEDIARVSPLLTPKERKAYARTSK